MRAAFTLVEVLVVTALAVVVTSMLFVVQQSTSRRSITTDRKRDAMIRAHRAYHAMHALLASSPRFDVATEAAAAPEEEGGEVSEASFDTPATSRSVTTPAGVMAFEPARGRLRVREATVDGLGGVTFHPESETLLAFVVDSGPADSARERSQLYGKQYFEALDDRIAYRSWAPPEEPEPVLPFAGGFRFPGTCGYRPKGGEDL